MIDLHGQTKQQSDHGTLEEMQGDAVEQCYDHGGNMVTQKRRDHATQPFRYFLAFSGGHWHCSAGLPQPEHFLSILRGLPHLHLPWHPHVSHMLWFLSG